MGHKQPEEDYRCQSSRRELQIKGRPEATPAVIPEEIPGGMSEIETAQAIRAIMDRRAGKITGKAAREANAEREAAPKGEEV